MINLNADVNSVLNSTSKPLPQSDKVAAGKENFDKAVDAVGKYLSKVDDLQQSSDMSVKDLLAGKNVDITSVVSAVAKADVSFKLLVGVRNKLIEAYKQTMNMPL